MRKEKWFFRNGCHDMRFCFGTSNLCYIRNGNENVIIFRKKWHFSIRLQRRIFKLRVQRCVSFISHKMQRISFNWRWGKAQRRIVSYCTKRYGFIACLKIVCETVFELCYAKCECFQLNWMENILRKCAHTPASIMQSAIKTHESHCVFTSFSLLHFSFPFRLLSSFFHLFGNWNSS